MCSDLFMCSGHCKTIAKLIEMDTEFEIINYVLHFSTFSEEFCNWNILLYFCLVWMHFAVNRLDLVQYYFFKRIFQGYPSVTCDLATTEQHLFNGPLSRFTQVSWYQKDKTNLDLLEQEIVSGNGISWAICKSAPRPSQITTPASTPPLIFLQVGCPFSGWPLFWKTWKCQGILQLSCKCQGMGLLSGNCQGMSGKNLVRENCYYVCTVWVAVQQSMMYIVV